MTILGQKRRQRRRRRRSKRPSREMSMSNLNSSPARSIQTVLKMTVGPKAAQNGSHDAPFAVAPNTTSQLVPQPCGDSNAPSASPPTTLPRPAAPFVRPVAIQTHPENLQFYD